MADDDRNKIENRKYAELTERLGEDAGFAYGSKEQKAIHAGDGMTIEESITNLAVYGGDPEKPHQVGGMSDIFDPLNAFVFVETLGEYIKQLSPEHPHPVHQQPIPQQPMPGQPDGGPYMSPRNPPQGGPRGRRRPGTLV